MKVSKYNFFMETDDLENDILAYNSMSNSLALMNKQKYEKYLEFEKNNIEIEDEEFVKDLQMGSFLIEENVNELDLLRFSMFKDRFSEGSLNLTIAPTLDCDFRCVYCYEKGKNDTKKMDKETQGSIVDLVSSKKEQIKSLNVIWYGGEPLLAMDIIENLSNQFIDICKENKIAYDSYIISNGYGLNRDICESFKNLNITAIQITIDGPSHIHDKRRFGINREPTYQKILNNIKLCKDIIPQVALRINVDKKNREYLKDLLEDFKRKDIIDVVYPYLGHVKNTNDCYKDSVCLSSYEYSELDFEFDSMVSSYNIEQNPMKYLPKRITSYCGADYINSHTIDAFGNMYRCWSDVGDKSKKVGNVNKLDFIINKNITDYVLFDATTNKKCRECKVLPLCMGGCPIKDSETICSSTKFMLDKHLKKVCKTILESRNQCLEVSQ